MTGRTYTVIRSNTNEHSVWPTDTPVPAGFDEVGVTGSQEHCESYVQKTHGNPHAASPYRTPEDDNPR
ncbi:MbtH family NRPS accessory protein [Streptomyces zhihengii]